MVGICKIVSVIWTEIDKFGQKLKLVDKKLKMWTEIGKDGQKFMEGR